jgi:hypothetical protein
MSDDRRADTSEYHHYLGADGFVYTSRQMREPIVIAPRYPLVEAERMDSVVESERSDAFKRSIAAWRVFIDKLTAVEKIELAKRLLGSRYEP